MAHVGVEGKVHGGAGRQEQGVDSESPVTSSLQEEGQERCFSLLPTTQEGGRGVGVGQGTQREAWNTQTGQQAEAGWKSWLP